VVIEHHLIPELGHREVGQPHLDAPRRTVVWQLDRWGDLVHPRTATSRRTIPLPPEVAAPLEAWLHRQQQRAASGSDNVYGLVFTTRNGYPIDQRSSAGRPWVSSHLANRSSS
jgi:integrase